MIPSFACRSMFGLRRAGDLVWAAGRNHHSDARSVVQAGSEMGQVTKEVGARAEGRRIGKETFPRAGSGRTLPLDRSEGIIKVTFDVTFDEADDRVIGAAIMGADAVDPGHAAVHPNPTPSGTVNAAAGMFEGTITDLMQPEKRP